MLKRVLHIAEAAGGVERYLHTLLTKLKKYTDFENILVCSSTFDVQKFNGLVADVIIIDSLQNSISISNDLKSIIAVRRVIKETKPDIIYCHSSKAGAVGRIADLGIANKVLYNAHGWSFNMKNTSRLKNLLYKNIERFLSLFTDKIICISDYEKTSALEQRICTSNKLIVINSGIDFDEYSDLHLKGRKELSIPEDAFVVGTVGRLTNQKAPDTFIKMAEIVNQKIPNTVFLMVGDDIGDGTYKEKIIQQIQSAGLTDKVIITGWVDHPLDYLGVFNVAVLLSRWEGFGLVLPEYMFMGKPIVATKADAIPYVVGDAGILVNIDDYQKAAESVVRLYEDKELMIQIVDKGNVRVKLFDAQRTADEHVELFYKVQNR